MSERVPARHALERFVASTAAALELLDDLSDADWQTRPPGEPWSLAQTIEHLVMTNQATLARLRAPRRDAESASLPDAAIAATMFDGVPPPPGAPEPTGCWDEPDAGVAALRDVRDAIAAEVRKTGDDLRATAAPHPVFGTFDGVQWVLFAAAHTDNHLPQLERLRLRR